MRQCRAKTLRDLNAATTRLGSFNIDLATRGDARAAVLRFCSALEGVTKCDEHWSELENLAYGLDADGVPLEHVPGAASRATPELDAFFRPLADLLTNEHARLLKRAKYQQPPSYAQVLARPATAAWYVLGNVATDSNELVVLITEARVALQWYIDTVRANVDRWTVKQLRAALQHLKEVASAAGLVGILLANVLTGAELKYGNQFDIEFKSSLAEPVKLEITLPVLSTEEQSAAQLAVCAAAALSLTDTVRVDGHSALLQVDLPSYTPQALKFLEGSLSSLPGSDPWGGAYSTGGLPGDVAGGTNDPDDTGPDDTGPDDTGPDDTGPDDTGPDDTGPDDTGPDDTGPDTPVVPNGPAGSTGEPTPGRVVEPDEIEPVATPVYDPDDGVPVRGSGMPAPHEPDLHLRSPGPDPEDPGPPPAPSPGDGF